jgi:site-specific recombinase XerD
MSAENESKRKRGHQPETEGSNVYCKRGWFHIDLRWRGGGRPVLRNPKAPGWPERGERTSDQTTAEEWARAYDAQWRKEQEEAQQRATGVFRSLSLGVEHFLRRRKRHKAPSTYSGSRTATAHLLEWVRPNVDPADVTADDLQDLFDDLVDAEYEVSSLHNIRYHLRMLFDHLKVIPNPARAVELAKPGKAIIVPWTEKQRDRVRAAADEIDGERKDSNRTCRRLVECFLTMGPRIQEAAAFQWENIDSNSKTVRISSQIERSTNEPTDTKGREPRSATVLPGWWEFHDYKATGLIFPGRGGHAIPYRTFYDLVREILERAGLKKPKVAAHQFRHTYAFDFIVRGGTLDELSKCLGHKKLGTTQKYYEHFTSDHAATRAAQRMYSGGAGTVRRGPRRK